MGLMSKLRELLGGQSVAPAAPSAKPATADSNTIPLPAEPYVFECQSCGKVFEARRKHPSCPECDSTAVSLMSE